MLKEQYKEWIDQSYLFKKINKTDKPIVKAITAKGEKLQLIQLEMEKVMFISYITENQKIKKKNLKHISE